MTSLPARLEASAFRVLMALPRPVMRVLAGRPVVLDGQTLDLETQWMLRLKELLREPGAETLPMAEGRRALRRQAALVGGSQPIGYTRDLAVPGAEGEIGARLYVPRTQVASGTPSGLLFFVHGGGMMHGDLDSHDALCRFLAEQAEVRVLSVDYRLAPEHPYPAAVEDCWASFQWVSEYAEQLGADPELIAVGGDSAGGYLAAVTAIRAAEAGLPVRWQMLVYPVTDMAEQSESRRMFGERFFLTADFMDLAETSYLGEHGDRRDPAVSVMFHEKFPPGLAPAFVAPAGFDPLRDEGEAYARLLAEHGVRVDLERYPGFIHGFASMVGVGRSNREAMVAIAGRLRRALG